MVRRNKRRHAKFKRFQGKAGNKDSPPAKGGGSRRGRASYIPHWQSRYSEDYWRGFNTKRYLRYKREQWNYGYNVRKHLENTRSFRRTFNPDTGELVYGHPMVSRQLQGSQVVGKAVQTLLQRLNLVTRLPSDYVGMSSVTRPSWEHDMEAYQISPSSGPYHYGHQKPSVPSEEEQIKEAIKYANSIDRKTMWQLGYYLFRARIPGNLGDVRYIGDIRQPRTIKWKWYDFINRSKVQPTEWQFDNPFKPTATDDVIKNRPCYHYDVQKKAYVPCSKKARWKDFSQNASSYKKPLRNYTRHYRRRYNNRLYYSDWSRRRF